MLLAIDLALMLEKLVLIVIVVFASLGIAMYATFAERKVAAILQDRRGPNRAGPFGILQPLADGMKLFFKEDIIPNYSSKFLFILGPALAMLTAIMTGAVIPWGDTINFFGRHVTLQIADVNVGILYVFDGRAKGGLADHQLRTGDGYLVDRFADGNGHAQPERNGGATAAGLVEYILPAAGLPDIFDLCFRGMQPHPF
jgi:hypothetical protein